VIVGDSDTPSCTSHEAFLMAQAAQIHAGLLTSGVDADDFFLEHFDLLQSVHANASMGVGTTGDGWSRHLENIKATLEDIEKLQRRIWSRKARISALRWMWPPQACRFIKPAQWVGRSNAAAPNMLKARL